MSDQTTQLPEPKRLTPDDLVAPVRLFERIGIALCWASAIVVCATAVLIIGYLFVKGLGNLSLHTIITRPGAGNTSKIDGILDPLLGTLILAVIGTAIALPLGVCIATWLVEYGKPFWLARATESGIEMIAGVPSVVLALFGTVIFSDALLGFLSTKSNEGVVLGRSFLVASITLSFVALPLIVGSTREGLQSIPSHVREASYAVGKTKIATIRRILWPSVTGQIASGTVVGMGRIIGDTSVLVLLLGITLQFTPAEGGGPFGILRGSGGSLTTFVYNYAPTGEGNQPGIAFAAAFVLLVIVLLLNGLVEYLSRKKKAPEWTN
ncbi:MAG: ABC transporter permease subunit [Solirubrobacterales bacterium]